MKYFAGLTTQDDIDLLRHNAFKRKMGIRYNENSTTKFLEGSIKHPQLDEFALIISEQNAEYFDPEIVQNLKTKAELDIDGWFPALEEDI
jgi:hypothetical protein